MINHSIGTLQPQTNVFVYYWDFGRVWEFFSVVENGNVQQLEELDKLMGELEAKNGLN